MSIQSKLGLLVAALVAGAAILATPEKAEAFSVRKSADSYLSGPVSARAPSCVRIPNLSKNGKTIFYSEVCA
jgi:hypothetical protein